MDDRISQAAISGVFFKDHHRVDDRRGHLETFFFRDWLPSGEVSQWNVVSSAEGVLRGVHAHSKYAEYYAPLVGRMFLVLKDARTFSPTFGAEMGVWIEEDRPRGVYVPEGVAHGVYFATRGILAYALSTSWTGDNEYNCRWDDSDIAAAWPSRDPLLSDRDTEAGAYRDMVAALNADMLSSSARG